MGGSLAETGTLESSLPFSNRGLSEAEILKHDSVLDTDLLGIIKEAYTNLAIAMFGLGLMADATATPAATNPAEHPETYSQEARNHR